MTTLQFPMAPGVAAFAADLSGGVVWWSEHFTRSDGSAPSLKYILASIGVSTTAWSRVQHDAETTLNDGWLRRQQVVDRCGNSLVLYVHSRLSRSVKGEGEGVVGRTPPGMARLIGESHAFRAAQEQIARAAWTDVSVLLSGETGVGKELYARQLHELSSRSAAPFVALNCAALPESVAEAELFGYDRGAFTGAAAEGKPGHFERAEGGTLFLDEIAELSLPLQAKLLRALQEGEIERVGGRRPIRVNVRIVSATNQDLREMIRQGRFRSDLYFRINVLRVRIPPLRERAGDIPLVAKHYLTQFTRKWGLEEKVLSPGALTELQAYEWPGNVRELISCTQRLVLLVPGHVVEGEDVLRLLDDLGLVEGRSSAPGAATATVDVGVPFGAGPAAGDAAAAQGLPVQAGSMLEQTARLERQLIADALAQARGNKAMAAQLLGIHRSTLYEKMQRYGIGAPEA